MRLCVLIPSEDYRSFAGARIRYGRIRAPLAQLGWTVDLREIGEFDPAESSYDAHLISKCHDARALICAHLLKSNMKVVGVDLFDDYFSQIHDSRLARFRTWLSDLIGMIDFVLCSTPAMARVAHTFRGDVPVHVMNDPDDEPAGSNMGAVLEQKLEKARNDRAFSIGWFGVGNNPNFPVGLHDLVAFGSTLRSLATSQWRCELKVLTNKQAFTADRLAGLRHLPLQPHISIWSEEAEQSLLDEALLCFLPVNAQNFSLAKSLNRAISALSSGCQVLSNGFPLYDRLDPLIYASSDEFLKDFSSGELRLRPATLPVYDRLTAEIASNLKEANALAQFLGPVIENRKAESAETSRRLHVVHGVASTSAVHMLAKKAGALSVGSPFFTARLDLDAFFTKAADGRLDLYVAKHALEHVLPPVRDRMRPAGKQFDEQYWSVEGDSLSFPADPVVATSPPVIVSNHRSVMKEMRSALTEAFGEASIILSEMSPLPLETTATSL
jgi:hypothetical protein